jgi:hypothetical protein
VSVGDGIGQQQEAVGLLSGDLVERLRQIVRPPPSKNWRATFSVAAAASVAVRPSRWSRFPVLQSTATREAAGTASFRSCNPFPVISTLSSETPVMFPPGRPRLGTIPVPTGSPTAVRTIGMVRVAFFAAIPPWVETATKMSGRPPTSSAASAGSRSIWAPAVRKSITRLRPST